MIDRDLNTWPKALRFLILILGDRRDEIDAVASTLTHQNWREFLRLAHDRHKVVPLVADRLAGHDLPAEVREYLADAVQANAMAVLKQIANTGAISKAFNAAGIDVTILKGWPLAEDLFGNPEHASGPGHRSDPRRRRDG